MWSFKSGPNGGTDSRWNGDTDTLMRMLPVVRALVIAEKKEHENPTVSSAQCQGYSSGFLQVFILSNPTACHVHSGMLNVGRKYKMWKTFEGILG
jgi:hypothetical protein